MAGQHQSERLQLHANDNNNNWFQLNHNTIRILPGPYLYTWVESSNVDKAPCWRTKIQGDSGNRTRALSTRVE